MAGILDRFTTQTIGMQIIELLNKNSSMRFSQIKNAMKKNDIIISRELKKLIELEPPIILKNEKKQYSLNREHPQLTTLLYTLGIIPKGTDYIQALLSQEKHNEEIGYGVIFSTDHVQGFKESLINSLEDKKMQEFFDKLYFGVLEIKIDNYIKSKIEKGDIKMDEIKEYYNEIRNGILEEGIEIHIIPIKRITSKL